MIKFFAFFFLAPNLFAVDLPIFWDRNPETFESTCNSTTINDFSGYKVYWKTISDSSYQVKPVMGDVTSTTLSLLPGSWVISLTAVDACGNESGKSNEITRVIALPPQLSTWSINFQPGDVTNPIGYVTDSGQTYNATRQYGWDAAELGLRTRGINADKRLDTFVFTSSLRTWQANVANGSYFVSLATGDAGYTQGPHRVIVEGSVLVNNVATTRNNFFSVVDAPVTVNDGKLTVQIGNGGGNTMLNYIVVKPASSPLPQMTVAKATSKCNFILSTEPPDSTIGWAASFYSNSSLVGSIDNSAPYSQTAELIVGSYQFSVVFSKQGQSNVTYPTVQGVCP